MKALVSLVALFYAGFVGAEQTLSILKPDAIENKHTGEIISIFEKNGLKIVAMKMTMLTPQQVTAFYDDLKDRPFFPAFVKFMTSGPVVISVLEGDNAVKKNRDLMGATDPKKAEKGTIRASFSESIERNTVHGSDSLESAKREIPFFFSSEEIIKLKNSN